MTIGTLRLSTQQFFTAASSSVVNLPATVNAGDFLWIWGRVNNIFTLPAITVPSGWTVVYHTSQAGGTAAPTMIFMYKTGMAVGTEGGTTVTITHSSNINTWISGAVSGVDTTTPIDATPLTGDTNVASGSSSLAGYTTTVAGCLGFFIASETGTAATSSPPTAPATWTEDADNTPVTNVGTVCHLAGLASGSQGTVANTWSASLKHIECMFALRPAAAGGTNWSNTTTDNEGITDSTIIEHGYGTIVTDDSGVTDTFIRTMDYSRPTTDNENLTDSVIIEHGYGLVPVDAENLTDSVIISEGYGRIITDDAGLTDQVVISHGWVLNVMDSVGVADSVSASTGSYSAVDSVGITDFYNILVIGGSLVAGTIMDKIMLDLIGRGFLTGTVLDRERARLVAALALPNNGAGKTIDDLYSLNGERNRVALESVAIVPKT